MEVNKSEYESSKMSKTVAVSGEEAAEDSNRAPSLSISFPLSSFLFLLPIPTSYHPPSSPPLFTGKQTTQKRTKLPQKQPTRHPSPDELDAFARK